jgi:hypothetical protein
LILELYIALDIFFDNILLLILRNVQLQWWCSGIYHFTICHEKKLNRKKENIFPCGSIFLDPTHSPLERKQTHMNSNKYTVVFLNVCFV